MATTHVAAAKVIILEFDLTASPTKVAAILRMFGDSRGWFDGMSELEVSEWCADLRGTVSRLLREHINQSRRENSHTRFEFNSSSQEHIQGSCFIEPTDSDELKEAKTRRASRSQYATYIRGISPRDLELVCRGVLDLLGCSPAVVTRSSGDQGIDFFGLLPLEGKLGDALSELPGVERDLKVWIAGQAKHYAGKASTPELRELAGSVALARAKVAADDGTALAMLELRLLDPVVYLFITSGSLSKDATQLARRSGIVLMDGEALAAFLADRGVGLNDGQFDGPQLQSWIDSQDSVDNAVTATT